MIRRNSVLYFCFAFLFLTPLNVWSQEGKKQSLVSIFKELEGRFEIQFNYAVLNLDVIFLAPVKLPSLDASLEQLHRNTVFSFGRIGERIVTVEREVSQVCGYIIDEKTGTPLEGVTVRSGNVGVATDAEGFFKFTSATNEIVIEHVGYQTALMFLEGFASANCSRLSLKSEVQILNEVLLSSYIIRGIDKLDDGNFEIDFSNFSILPGLVENDVLQSAQSLPGIQSSNETVSNINIRGGSNDQNLLLWDDIKMYQSGHFFGLISAFNPQITARVKVIKNGTDAAYTDGVSGTISMATETALPDQVKANIGLNFLSADGFVDVPISTTSSIQVAARKSLSDFAETPTYKRYFDRISQSTEINSTTDDIFNSDKQFDFYDTSLRWLYKIGADDELRLNFINIGNTLVFNENATIGGDEESKRSSLTQNSIAGGVFYEHQWQNDSKTNIHVYETDYKLRAINVNILASQRFLQENIVSETGVRLQHSADLNARWDWLVGYHGVETEITNLDDVDDPLFRERISNVLRTHSLFSQINFKSETKRTNMKVGVRTNYIDKFRKILIEPRLSITQRVSPQLSAVVSGELKHQNTSQIINFQNDFLGVEKRRWQLANDSDIPILQSMQFTAGLNYEQSGWLIDVEGYWKEVDGITMGSQGFQTKYQFTKGRGSYAVFGVDFLIRKEWKGWSSWLSYSTMDNTYHFPQLEERTFRSNFNIRHAIKMGSAYRIGKCKIAAGVNWHTGKPTTALVQGQEVLNGALNFETINQDRLDDYIRIDVSAVYQLATKRGLRMDIGLSVWNVINQENTIDNFYRVNEQVEAQEFVQRALGITTNAVLRVHL